MKLFFPFFLILFLSSCINTTMHNQNRAFNPFFVAKKEDCKENEFCLIEIEATQIRQELASKNKLIWVHLWRYYCKSTVCKSLNYYEELSKKYPNITFLLISETYNYKEIRDICQKQHFSQNIYVIKHDTYGNSMTRNRKQFVKELLGQAFQDSLVFHNDYVFSKDKLCYAGEEISDSILSNCAEQ